MTETGETGILVADTANKVPDPAAGTGSRCSFLVVAMQGVGVAFKIEEIPVAPQLVDRFRPLLGDERMREVEDVATRTAERMVGRTWWNINSTARGGGVAEMLQSLLGYARGAGIDARWLVITGSPGFFHLTKRLHHAFHGLPGDGSALGEAEREIYEATLAENADELLALVRPDDVVLLHDPQTAGLAPTLHAHGAIVLWRSHIGADRANDQTDLAWRFLRPYLEQVDALVFTRAAYHPTWCHPARCHVITPSIDAFSPKNQEMDEATVRAILVHTGLVEGPPGDGQPLFRQADGTPGRVDRQADIVRLGRAPTWETPLVVQVSRWDPLKDPIGVMHGFAELISRDGLDEPELLLAGPNVTAVADDPEAAAVFDEVVDAWQALPHAIRGRVQLASLPMADLAENAAIVNAIQRHAAVVVQKSLQEGFGLTVTEAMWKGRPVVASRVGGIQEQIDDGVHGLLVDDPADPHAFANALRRVLTDGELAERLGRNARERVREAFLGVRNLIRYAELLERIETQDPGD
jgi:trehalose synthase